MRAREFDHSRLRNRLREDEDHLPSVAQARAVIPQILARVQKDYDRWDEEDRDTYAGGGICHIIADSMCEVLSDLGIDCTPVSCSSEQHVYIAARFREGVYTIDIPYYVYETGGGFSWKKIPDVRFDARDVVFYRVSGDPAAWRDYIDEGFRGVTNFVRNLGRDRDAPIVMMTNPRNRGARAASDQRISVRDFPLKTVAVAELRPWEPMIKMQDLPSQRTVASLVQTLRQGGSIPPLLVTPVRGGYRIIDGHHRYAALQRAGIDRAAVRVVDPRLIRYSDEVLEALRTTVRRYGKHSIQEDRTATVELDGGERRQVRYVPGRGDWIDWIIAYYWRQGRRVLKVDEHDIDWDDDSAVITQAVAEGLLNESAYEEAWELISQPVPEIQQFVKQLGLVKDDTTAKQIAPMIDATSDTQLPAASIPRLKNLANKGNDVQTLKAIQQISGRPDAAQQYARIMQARDAGEGRQRGYDVNDLLNSVKSGNYESPVLLKLTTGTYVIGGRTRLYAALALGIPVKVKIISVSTFSKPGQQGVAEGRVKKSNAQRNQTQDLLSQIPNLIWQPVNRDVWNTIQDEGLDEEQDAPNRTDWLMAFLSISQRDAQALQALDDDAIEKFNRFDIQLKSRYPGLTDLIDYDNGTITIVKTSQPGIREGRVKDMDIDLQDQQWEAVVGFVQHGVRRGRDADRMSIDLYRWAGGEQFDVDEELERRGFASVTDLADHIREHGGRYRPPEFDLSGAASLRDIERLPRRRDDDVQENFADGRKPGRRGLSRRVGIPRKATLGQLEKIAQSSTGERRRMAQWQLNMRRGKARKNK